MAGAPLPTLLSWAWLASTIEFDNEFERAMAEIGEGTRFRVSRVMWSSFLRFVPERGIEVAELIPFTMAPAALVRPTLAALERWGYVRIGPQSTVHRRDGYGSGRGITGDTTVEPTRLGRLAQDAWRPMARAIDDRWRVRFGEGPVDRLHDAVSSVVASLRRPLPDAVPIVAPSNGFTTELRTAGVGCTPAGDLAGSLAQALVAFTTDAERETHTSMPLAANLLRVLGDEPVRVRELPLSSGVSKVAVTMAAGYAERKGLARVVPDPAAARGKVVCLTAAGRAAREDAERAVADVEQRWRAALGADRVDGLRAALDTVLAQPDALADGLVPAPTGWRAERPYLTQTEAVLADPLAGLPRHPMVLHRGGWPDGA
jgi:DNA-binding MarR family transcriptional regulator